MVTLFTVRALLLVAALVVVGVAAMPANAGDDKKKDPPKLPPLDSKEWKALGDKGLKVWDVKEGKGDAAKAGAMVTIHYTGWTLDGKIFDSSVTRGEPAQFPLKNLIKGWQVGVPGMKPGGVRRLSIPYQLAYGEAGRPPTIPAKATLIFEIEAFENKK